MLDVSKREVKVREVVQKKLVFRDGKYIESQERVMIGQKGEFAIAMARTSSQECTQRTL